MEKNMSKYKFDIPEFPNPWYNVVKLTFLPVEVRLKYSQHELEIIGPGMIFPHYVVLYQEQDK